MTVKRTSQSAACSKPGSSRATRDDFGVSLGDRDKWPSENESEVDSEENSKPPPSPTGPRNVLRQLAYGGPKMAVHLRDDTAADSDSQSSSTSDYEYVESDTGAGAPPNAHHGPSSPRSRLFVNHESDGDEYSTDEEDANLQRQRQQSTPSRHMADVSTGSRSDTASIRQETSQSPFGNLPPLPQPPADYVALPPIVMPTGQVVEPVPFSNANPSVLGLENLGLFDFLRGWAAQRHFGAISGLGGPDLQQVLYQESLRRKEISYNDLKGDYCDFQGLNWRAMGTNRKVARSRRRYTYRNYVNRQDSDKWNTQHCSCIGKEESNFFKFKRTNFQSDIRLAHFQLRSILGCPNRNAVFFPGHDGIQRFHTLSRQTDTFMRVPDFAFGSSTVTSLDANHGVLMCGTFEGNYCVKSLESETTTPEAKGQVSKYESGITNYIKIEQHRSSSIVAAIASNDDRLRLYDVATDTFVAERIYPVAMNCTALSPDGQLRALVGDADKIFITDEKTGSIQFELHGHRDYGFACAWSDDGHTLATGSQDMAIKIWDARYWQDGNGTAKPLHTIKSELAGARTLKFSPLGSGPRVLVAAEEADYVNIIDAVNYETKQTIDVFGEICGAAFTAEGQDLNILCRDIHRGGLLQFERCGGGLEKLHGLPRTDRWTADDDVVDPF